MRAEGTELERTERLREATQMLAVNLGIMRRIVFGLRREPPDTLRLKLANEAIEAALMRLQTELAP